MGKYIHGTHVQEQDRLSVLNDLLNDRCLAKLQLQGDESILDIGCGLGLFSRQLRALVPHGKVVGVERKSEQITRGIELAMARGYKGEVDFRKGSAYDLPLLRDEAGTFDLVFIRFLLEHLQDPLLAVQQAHTALRSGGRIILVDDDHANFRITPAQPAFERLWPAYCRVYESLGQDPYIGRKLVTLLHQGGFGEFKADFVLFGGAKSEDNFMHYASNLIGIIAGAKEEIIELGMQQVDFDDDIAALGAWAQLPDATLWYSANWAEGVKQV